MKKMAKFEHKFKIGFRDVGAGNQLSNKGLIGFLEDTAGLHSDMVGYGLNNISSTNLTWVLLNWKIRVFKRPYYSENVLVKTWARDCVKFYTFRDFEVFNDNNELVAIATTKWVLLDANTMSLTKISDEILGKYNPELISVFKDEPEIGKITIPTEYSNMKTYTIQRKDMDINQHVHNTYYLDFAYEVLPENVYKNAQIDNFEILYKKETKLGETIKCFYTQIENSHYIVMKTEDEKNLHCVVRLDENVKE
jgi:medium-chain acyl-[acyl-carrier-protein] hydrolase